MADPTSILPEGTQSVFTDDLTASPVADAAAAGAEEVHAAASKFGEEASRLRDKASEKAFAFAAQGKDKASDALDSLSRLVGDAAGTVDEKVGTEYGDYARRAAGAVSGLAGTLRSKEVEDIIADASAFVRKSPAVAIGTAAVIGFVLLRLVKSSGSETPAA